MSSSPAILSMASTTDQLPWLSPELSCMFVSGFSPFCCWSEKERCKSWEKPAPSHSPSHHQSPQSRLFSRHCMTSITTGTWSAWEFFQPVFRATFLLGRVLWCIFYSFPFSKDFAGSVGAAWQAPNLTSAENVSAWILHTPWISHQTGYIGDNDSPCMSAFSQACSLVKLCQKWQNWSFHGCCTRTHKTEALLCCAIHATAQY